MPPKPPLDPAQGSGSRSRLVMAVPTHPHAGPWQWQFAAPRAPVSGVSKKLVRKPVHPPSLTPSRADASADLATRLLRARAAEQVAKQSLLRAQDEVLNTHRAIVDLFLRTGAEVPYDTVQSTVNVVSSFLRARLSSLYVRNFWSKNKLYLRRRFPSLQLDASDLNRLDDVAIEMGSSESSDTRSASAEYDDRFDTCHDSCEAGTEEPADDGSRTPALDGKAVTHMIELFDAMYDAEAFELNDFATPQRHRSVRSRSEDPKDDTTGLYDSLAFDADRRSATQDRLYQEVCEDETRHSAVSVGSPQLGSK